ncbi:MAG TPA: single-stranded DNA-binding protein [Solirubrobacteraceae bacterium]|nr:single-stranded DNA-binding protein [Solirubrobacteraceae bacterium]
MSYFTINRVVLIGRLTRDPELRALPSGTSVCGLRIACNSSRRDSDGGFLEKPNFFDVTVYGSSAESVSRYTRKGSRVAVDGRLEWREWETAEQQRRQAVSVVADTVQFLDGPSERSGIDGSDPDGDSEETDLVGVGGEVGGPAF